MGIDREDSPFEPEQEDSETGDSDGETTSKKQSVSRNFGKMRSKGPIVTATTNTQGNATNVDVEDHQALAIRELRKRRFESLSSKEPGKGEVPVEGDEPSDSRDVKRVKHDKDSASTRTGRTRQGAAYNWDGKFGEGRKLG